MATLARSLTMPNGDEYEFIGRTYYGICSTAANLKIKIVDIPAFSTDSLVDGTRIVVYFVNENSYRPTISGPSVMLNVSDTGAKSAVISSDGGMVQWKAGEVVSFIYKSEKWIAEGKVLANANIYGITKLSSSISNDSTTALTPSAVYNAGYVTSSAIPTKTSDLTNDSGFLTSESDPVFSASAASGITATDISNWNAKVSDDHKWNDVALTKGPTYVNNGECYIPYLDSYNNTVAYTGKATAIPTAKLFVKYDDNGYLNSITSSANDNSTKVATTAYVKSQGYLTLADLPVYDGSVT